MIGLYYKVSPGVDKVMEAKQNKEYAGFGKRLRAAIIYGIIINIGAYIINIGASSIGFGWVSELGSTAEGQGLHLSYVIWEQYSGQFLDPISTTTQGLQPFAPYFFQCLLDVSPFVRVALPGDIEPRANLPKLLYRAKADAAMRDKGYGE